MGLLQWGEDLITKNNPIAGGIRAGVELAQGDWKGAAGDLANGYTAGGAGYVWDEATKAYKKIEGSLYPSAPPPAGATPAGQAASAQADKLAQNFNSMPAPTYGTAGTVPVSAPTAPAATARDAILAAGSGQNGGTTYSTQNFRAPTSTAALAVAPNSRPQTADAAASAKAQADYDAIYGGKAATSNTDITASTVGSRDVNYQPGFQAAQIANAPQIDRAGMIDPNALPQTHAQQVQAPGDVRAGTVTAGVIGPQTQATVADIPTDSTGRDAQLEALNRYRGVAEGTAPSAAQALLRQSTDESIGAQLGLAATLQGNTPGLALRSGLSGAANALAKSGSTMAALRAQEQETGRAGFLTAATGIRTGDIQIAQSNQTKDLTTAANNLTAQVDILKANQQAALDAGKTNVANDLQAQITNASNKLDAAKANAVNSLNSDIANLTATLDASKANQATQVSQNIADLNARMQTLTANLQAATSVGNANEANRVQSLIADANRELDAQKANQQALLDAAKARAQENQFNAGQENTLLRQNKDLAATAAAGNADRALRQSEVNNNLYTSMGQLANNALGLPLGVAQADIARAQAAKEASAATTANLIGGVLGLGGKALQYAYPTKPPGT